MPSFRPWDLADVIDIHLDRAYGINFASLPGSEALLLRIAHAFEQATQVRSKGRTYAKATPRTQLADIVSFPCT